jgi:hypothetical protein
MKTNYGLVAALLALLSASAIHAETSLVLDVAFGIRYVPPSVVSVPQGERVTVKAPSMITAAQWHKDGQPLTGATDPTLIFESANPADAGIYVYTPTGPGIPERGSQLLVLNVGPEQRFLNLSTRALAGTGDQTLIAGFVVGGTETKKVLVRAVGPSLAKFGMTGFIKEPLIKIFDSAGRPYVEHYDFAPGGRAAAIEEATRKTGAFPFIPGSKDAVDLVPFRAGAYTVQVGSGDGSTGTALLELYEVR